MKVRSLRSTLDSVAAAVGGIWSTRVGGATQIVGWVGRSPAAERVSDTNRHFMMSYISGIVALVSTYLHQIKEQWYFHE